ncbi:MAG: hypothetical protein RQ751_10230, partial [Longimicrobiales bacterium]|nr:hypothetical protein [Longimicrobiales bacterium]
MPRPAHPVRTPRSPTHTAIRFAARPTSRTASRLAAALLLLAAAAGCDAGPGAGGSPAVTDSAGVVLVRNGALPAWSPEQGWWVEEVLRVGGPEAPPELRFGYIADVAVDSAGTLFVLDPEARTVVAVAPDGTHLRTMGGPGEGAGALGPLPSSLVTWRDEVWVADWTQGRMKRFGPDGAPRRPFLLPHGPGARSWWSPAPEEEIRFRAVRRVREADGSWGIRDALFRLRPDFTADTVFPFDYPRPDLGTPEAPRTPAVLNAPA